MASTSMSDSQQNVLGPIEFLDKKGQPVPQPAGTTISWLVDNPAILAITPSADTLSCNVAAVGPLGTGTVSVKALAADGSTDAAGSVDYTITGGQATQINIPVGAPTEQP